MHASGAQVPTTAQYVGGAIICLALFGVSISLMICPSAPHECTEGTSARVVPKLSASLHSAPSSLACTDTVPMPRRRPWCGPCYPDGGARLRGRQREAAHLTLPQVVDFLRRHIDEAGQLAHDHHQCWRRRAAGALGGCRASAELRAHSECGLGHPCVLTRYCACARRGSDAALSPRARPHRQKNKRSDDEAGSRMLESKREEKSGSGHAGHCACGRE